MALEGGSGGGSARGIRAGAAYVEFNGKDNLTGFLGRMQKRFVGAMKAMAAATVLGVGVGLAGITAAAGPLIETIQGLGKIQDVADAFGLTGRAASGLFGVLNSIGGDFKENIEGIIQFSGTMEKAIQGVGQGAELFNGLALSAKDLAGLNVDEQFYRVLGAIRQLPQPMQEAKLAMLGGTDSMKQWQKLLTMSEADVRSLAEKLSFSNAELRRAANASAAYQRATGAIGRAWQQIAVAVAPAVERIAGWVEKAADGFTGWIRGREIGNLLAEVWVRSKIGIQEAIIFLRDGLSALWETFTTGDNFKKFTAALWELVKSLVGYVIGSLATAVPIITRGLTEIVKNMLMASGTLKTAAGDKEGAQRDRDAIASLNPDTMRADIQAAMAADARRFDEARKKLNEIGGDLERNFAKSAARNADADAADRKLLDDELAAVLGEAFAQRWTAGFMEFLSGQPNAMPAAAAQDAARVGRALGTFGAGSFLSQGFGVQSAADVGKQMVKEQKATNKLLAGIEKKLMPDTVTA